jgi:hypothetical protein
VFRRRQSGIGLGELLLLVAVASLTVVAAVTHLLPGSVSRESVSGMAQRVHTALQRARVEAVSLERPCRVIVDGTSVAVVDTMGTASPTDDRSIHRATFPDTITVGTLGTAGGAPFVEFRPGGDAAPGAITLFDGNEYRRVTVAPTARLSIERWDGSRWLPAEPG